MEGPDLWVANDDGTEIIRARAIVAMILDYNGNVAARIAGHEGTPVTLVAHRDRHDEARPGDLHRALLRVVAQLGDTSGAHIVRPVHDETRGWEWVGEPL